MSVILTKDIRIAGVLIAAGPTVRSYTAEFEADLVASSKAVYSVAPQYPSSNLTAAHLAAIAANPPAKQFAGTRILTGTGQGGFGLGAANYTWGLQCALPDEFVALRLVLGNNLVVPITGVTACASSGATGSDKDNNAGAWVNATFSGSASVTLAAGTAQNPSLTLSDWIVVPSVTRGDGGTKSLAYVRCMTPQANANAPLFGLGVGITGWSTKPDGMLWAWRFQSGDFVTTPTGMTGSADPSASPIIGVQYLTKNGYVTSHAFFGDSITSAYLATIPGDSWANQLCTPLGSKAACANLGWAGQTIAQIYARAQVYIPLLKPAVAWMPVFSPNGTLITAAVQNDMFATILQFLELCRANKVVPVLWSGMPKTTDSTNTTSFYTIAQDDLRKSLNNRLATMGITIVDMAAAMSDTTALGTASKWVSTAVEVDGIHPSDTGNAVMATTGAPVMAYLSA